MNAVDNTKSGGITAFGGYLPESRIDRTAILDANAWANPGLKGLARGRRAAAAWDEDSLTMAVEAGRSALAANSGPIDRITLASTTLPFADRQNAGLVAAALGLDENISAMDMGGALKAGTSALIMALEAPGTSLVVASDRRLTKPASQQEMLYGDASAAITTGTDNVLARFIAARSVSRDMVDHYRGTDSDFDYTLEERWVREEGYLKIVPDAVNRLLDDTGTGPEAIDHFILPCPLRGLPEKVAAKIGIQTDAVRDNLGSDCGFAGTAHPLLMVAHCLEKARPGQKILVVGFGQGADVILLEVTDAITGYQPTAPLNKALRAGRSDSNYMRFLSNRGLLDVDWGMRAERDNRTALSTFYRKRDIITAFEGGKCSQCGTAQFPRTHICVNPNCNAEGTQAPYDFSAATGRIKSFTEDWQGYCPDPPLKYGNVSFEGGGNIMMELADFAPGEAQVDNPLRMVFRIKDFDRLRRFRRYFWKAAPADAPRPENRPTDDSRGSA